MNLNDFKNHIDPIILQRGLMIYHQKAYSDYQKNANTYTLTAHGSSDYHVSITLDEDQNMRHMKCDCPYDQGPVCKHVAALYVAILRDNATHCAHDDEPSVNQTIQSIIRKLDRDILEDYILKHALEDDDFYNELMFRFGQDDQKIKLAFSITVNEIKSVEEAALEYADHDDVWSDAYSKISQIIHEAKNEALSPSISVQYLNEVIKACMTAETYESDFASNIISDTLLVLDQLTEKWSLDQMSSCNAYEAMMAFFLANKDDVLNHTIGDYVKIIGNLKCVKHKDTYYELLLELENDVDLDAPRLKKIQYAIYSHLNIFFEPHVSKTYLLDRLDDEVFLEIAYERAMDEKDFDRAVFYANQLIKQYSNTWNLKAYEQMLIQSLIANHDHETAKIYLRAHVLLGDHDAFKTYEAYFSNVMLDQEITKLLEDLDRIGHVHTLFIEIAQSYQRHDALIAYTEKYNSAILKAYPHLPQTYEARVFDVFKNFILRSAVTATDRKAYRGLATLLYHAKKALGQSAKQIEEELLSLYPRKHALKEEITQMIKPEF